MATIRIAASGACVEAPEGSVVLDVLQDAGIPIATECGGSGRCGLCVIHVRRGAECFGAPNRIEREVIGGAGRLACQTEIVRDGEAVIDVPDPSEMLKRGLT